MFHKSHTRPLGPSLLGLFLAVLIGTGMVPRQWLHEALADHPHIHRAISPDGQPDVSASGIPCHFPHYIPYQHTYSPDALQVSPAPAPAPGERYSSGGVSYSYTVPRYFFSLHAPPVA